MDTKFWGPSGWRLLHLIAMGPRANSNLTFWKMLPFVLPCKFCRSSLSTYYEQYPIPTKQEDFAEWLYKIHNCVNQKLRDQGQTLPPNPPFSAVQERYRQMLEQGCTRTSFPGWRFLFCLADNHPASSPSKPMPDTPIPLPTSLKERNKYNLLTVQERKSALKRFWASIPNVLPFDEWCTSWKEHAGSLSKAVANRKSALQWLWKIRCSLDTDLEELGKTDFYGLCKKIATYRSGCATNKRAKTCRRVSGGSRKTRRLKQR